MQPGNSSISISAVEQRLTVMLEELERGLRRTGAVEQIGGASFREVARPVAKHKASCQFNFKKSGVCSASSRALAIAIVIGGFAMLTPSLTSWITAINPFDAATIERGIEPVSPLTGVATSAKPPSTDASAYGASAQLRSTRNLNQTVDSMASEEKVSAASGNEPGGLSIEEFEVQVQRLLAQERKRAQTTAVPSKEWPDNPLLPDGTSPISTGEPLPEPLTPPAVANLAPEQGPQAELADKPRNPPPLFANSSKANIAPGLTKAKRSKTAVKHGEAPTRNAAPTQDSSGPDTFIKGATEALRGLVKNWGQ